MVNARNFNKGGWDISNVTNMKRMFVDARNFNYNINIWNISKVTNVDEMFIYSGYSYDIDMN